MNKINYRISLDVQKGGIQKTLHGFFTGEILARRIVISLVGGSVPCVFDENTVAIMYVTKANGVTSYNACTIEENSVFYDVLQTDVDAEGITTMHVKVMSGDTVLYAPMFAIEVQKSNTSDTEATTTPTFTALEEALVKAETVYNGRLVSIEILEDLTFVAYYADGSTYTSTTIKDRLGALVDKADSMAEAEEERVKSEEERVAAEQKRDEDFSALKEEVQNISDEAKTIQKDVESLISANGVTKEEKAKWSNKADGLSYENNTLALMNGDEVLESVIIETGGGSSDEIVAGIMNGTIVVPKAQKDEYGYRFSERYVKDSRVNSIHTGCYGTMSEIGWYRIAQYHIGGNVDLKQNSCTIFIKRHEDYGHGEALKLEFISCETVRRFKATACECATHFLTKIRYAYDDTYAYLEVYNAGSGGYLKCDIYSPEDSGGIWECVEPVLVPGTADRFWPLVTYTIPASVTPATSEDLARYQSLSGGTVANATVEV